MSHTEPSGSAQPLGSPPGPQDSFAFDANAATLAYLTDGVERYGNVWAMPPTGAATSATGGGGLPVWVVNDPDAIHQILTKKQPSYGKGVGFERVKMLLGDGLIVSDGDHWRKRRQMLQPAFSRPSVARATELIRTCIEDRGAGWESHADSGEPFDVSEEANLLGLRIILRSIFGDDLELLDAREGGNPFHLVTNTHTRDLMFAMRFRQLWPVVREIAELRRERGGAPKDDFLGRYMAAVDKGSGEPLDMQGLVDEIMTLLVAGHETSAATIAWAWSLLARNEAVQRDLRTEVMGQVGLGAPDAPALKGLDLGNRIVHETLRLYPPVWMFTRQALQDDVLAGYRVPAGTQILLTPFLLHRCPEFWDEPERFDPGRIPASGIAPVRGAYIPFSAGPRRCAGDLFALNVVVQHLVWTAGRYHLTPVDPGVPELDPGVNLRALHPIRLRVRRA